VSFERVAVLGLGAMGGSLARALSALNGLPTVVGWSPDGTERIAALEADAIGVACDGWRDAVAGADLVVVATPINAACELLGEIPASLSDDALVTDVASLKAPIVRAARAAGLGGRFVGSHPMAGSERSGFGASRADLYGGATVWLVAEEESEPATGRIAAFWSALDAVPRSIDAEAHDRMMALVSHLPQLTATALAHVLADAGLEVDALGPGGQDTTRLAASEPSVWRDILAHTPAELAEAHRATAALHSEIAERLEAGDIDGLMGLMERARAWKLGR
jgi:prephenate dehydrogenase